MHRRIKKKNYDDDASDEQHQIKTVSSSSSSSSMPASSSSTSPTDDEQIDVDMVRRERAEGMILSIAVFVVSCIIYAKTAYPSLPGGDSGELIVAAYNLGVAHPPGYPLFTLVGYLFAHGIPESWGSVAFRVNLVSVVCTAGAGTLMFHTIQKFLLAAFPPRVGEGSSASAWIALFGAGYFCFFPLVWLYALQAEVFGMSSFFASLLSLQTVRCLLNPTVANGLLGAFFIGLGLTNQHTLIFFALPYVGVIVFNHPVFFRPKVFCMLMLCGVIGLLPYAYLPWACARNPPGGWGDETTLEGFLTHVLRSEYGTFRLYPGDHAEKNFFLAIRLYLQNIQDGTFKMGLPLAATSLLLLTGFLSKKCASGVKALKVARCLILTYLFYMIVFHLLSDLPVAKPLYRGVHMRFWLQPNVSFFTFFGWGLGTLIATLRIKLGIKIPWVLIALASVYILTVQVQTHYEFLDQSDNYSLRDYGLAHLEKQPQNSLLIVAGDMGTNSIRYLQYCENVRRDIEHVDQAMMTYKWYRKTQQPNLPGVVFPGEFYHPYKNESYSMGEFLDDNSADGRPIFVCGYFNHAEQEGGGIPGYVTIPMGICEQVLWHEDAPDFSKWLEDSSEALPQPTRYWPPPSYWYNDETWEYLVGNDYWSMHYRYVEHIHALAKKGKNDTDIFDQHYLVLYTNAVIEMLSNAIIQVPYTQSPDYFWRNVGIAFGRIQPDVDPLATLKMVAAFKKYIDLFRVRYEEAPEIWDAVIRFEKFHGNVTNPDEVLGLPLPAL